MPLEMNKSYRIDSKITDIQDKGKLSIIVCEKTISDIETDKVYSKVTSKIVARDFKNGLGFKGNSQPPITMKKPDREPDFVAEDLIGKD